MMATPAADLPAAEPLDPDVVVWHVAQTLDLDSWSDLLGRSTNPVLAEITGGKFVATRRSLVSTAEELVVDLASLVELARVMRQPETVALLRTLAAVGPEPVRASAAEAADHLVATGLPDPAWAKGLGQPKVGRCYGYRDLPGGQHVLLLTFRYGRWPHAFAVLIDHTLGGGVKDCWVSDHPILLRDQLRFAAARSDTDLDGYSLDEAKAIMDAAPRCEPCPVEDDQIDCIEAYLDLLRLRVALMADDASPPAAARTRARNAPPPPPRRRCTG